MCGILVISDVRLFRDGLGAELRQAFGDDQVDACRLQAAVEVLRTRNPDVLVVELGPGATDVVVAACERVRPPRVLGLALTLEPGPVVAAAALGVRAFFGPDQALADLVPAVHRVRAGEAVCPAEIASLLFAHLSAGAAPGAASCLTPREREVAMLLSRGMSNKEIATELYVEPATVKNHVHNILGKLHVQRRGEAAAVVLGRSGHHHHV